MMRNNKTLITIFLATALILLIPFIAMQFTDEVNWSLLDFVLAGTLLLGAGLTCEFVWRKVKKTGPRVALCLVAIIILLFIWAELAIGIFGSPISGN
jgi:hypothetical protein